jgi:hypothetical protein
MSVVPQKFEPNKAVRVYLGDEFGKAPDWLRKFDGFRQQKHLQYFLGWCEESGIKNISALSEDDLERYRQWREMMTERQDRGQSKIRLQSSLTILKLFFEHCAEIGSVETELHESEVLSYDE